MSRTVELTHEEIGPYPEAYTDAPLQDSGDRTEFESGAVRDLHEGKGRMDLMPLGIVADLMEYEDMMLEGCALAQFERFLNTHDHRYLYSAIKRFIALAGWDFPTAMIELSKHFEAGAVKYGERNWEKGISAHSYVDSSIRHYMKFLRGDKDEPHDRAVLWNWVCLWWTLQNRPECDDISRNVTI